MDVDLTVLSYRHAYITALVEELAEITTSRVTMSPEGKLDQQVVDPYAWPAQNRITLLFKVEEILHHIAALRENLLWLVTETMSEHITDCEHLRDIKPAKFHTSEEAFQSWLDQPIHSLKHCKNVVPAVPKWQDFLTPKAIQVFRVLSMYDEKAVLPTTVDLHTPVGIEDLNSLLRDVEEANNVNKHKRGLIFKIVAVPVRYQRAGAKHWRIKHEHTLGFRLGLLKNDREYSIPSFLSIASIETNRLFYVAVALLQPRSTPLYQNTPFKRSAYALQLDAFDDLA